MKVVAINGSPRKKGNTAFALNTVLEVLEKEGIETQLLHIGKDPIRGCTSCYVCMQKQNRQCRYTDDCVNEYFDIMAGADGILLGSPVYYAGIAGGMKAFLDRIFFVAQANNGLFRLKVGAGVAAVRRAGSLLTVDQLHKYLGISEMLIPTSNYWNEIHGLEPGEAAKDDEGVQCMQVLGANMAWLLKLIEHGKAAVPPPAKVEKIMTNFIR